MKDFFKTFTGKGILYALVIILALILSLMTAGAVYMISYDYYDQSESAIEESEMRQMAENDMLKLFYNNFSNITGTFRIKGDVIDNGNLLYRFTDSEGNVMLSSSRQPQEYAYKVYISVSPEENKTTDGNHYYITGHYYSLQEYEAAVSKDEELFVLESNIDNSLKITDKYKLFHSINHILYSMRRAVYIIGTVDLILLIISFVSLMCVAGRRPKTEEIVPWYFHKVPYELLLAPGAIVLPIALANSIEEEMAIAMVGISGVFFPLLCMSTAVRIKTHTLIKNTLTYRIIMLLWKMTKAIGRFIVSIIKNMRFLYKVIIGLLAVMTVWLMTIAIKDFNVFFLIALVAVPAVLLIALQINKLDKGISELSSGNFDYVIDTRYMLPEIKKQAENLNKIADAQKIALSEKLKSERMKTELITNVSHDIKTPLTSIINYADLISKEDSVSDNAKEYSEVLVRQSERLKRLLEDLVEASKAATGNLEVELAPCNADVFISQTAGEYEDKLNSSDLKLVTDITSEEIRIMADGRRMQRVFDNLMNNICKYSMPGTRVYLALRKEGNDAVFEFKNTSKEALNMSEEELMERFTRGDSSRNTEGSGLGLSIAKNLTDLQGGNLRIVTDGDLFKAILTFKTV